MLIGTVGAALPFAVFRPTDGWGAGSATMTGISFFLISLIVKREQYQPICRLFISAVLGAFSGLLLGPGYENLLMGTILGIGLGLFWCEFFYDGQLHKRESLRLHREAKLNFVRSYIRSVWVAVTTFHEQHGNYPESLSQIDTSTLDSDFGISLHDLDYNIVGNAYRVSYTLDNGLVVSYPPWSLKTVAC